MGDFRRNYVSGGTYFFTVVTHRRRTFLASPLARGCLREAFIQVRRDRPFDLLAIVLLPEHVHCVWMLPTGDCDFSTRWRLIKSRFTSNYLSGGGREGEPTAEQRHQQGRGIWQPRFWEHTCRDEEDLKRCVDYIHWNPVKHGLVRRVRDYPWSSFKRFVQMGEYTENWGGTNPCPGWDQPE
jgi:putative transposase